MSVLVASWIMVMLAAFGLAYARDVIGESRSVGLEVDRHQLRALARSGIELTRVTLATVPPTQRARLSRAGADNPLAGPHDCGPGRFAVGQTLELDALACWAPGVGDEASRLPVAIADSASLSLLPGMTAAGCEVIGRARRQAAELRLPPFEALPLDEASLACARRYLSRHASAVNVNTAPAAVLRAVGLPDNAIDKLLDWRDGPDRMAGTSDDRTFDGLEHQQPGIKACALNSEEAAVLAYLHGTGRLTVESRFYRVAARGWAEGHAGICEVGAILEVVDPGPARIVEWTERWLN